MNIVDRAFSTVPRADFLPDENKARAGHDVALPIGYGQTNSQPSTVYMMLTWLEVERGNSVLDVGSGSGWTTALLSYLVGASGKVYAVERQPDLLRFGEANCRINGVRNARFFRAGKHYGLTKFAPYDRILVSASADRTPPELLEQLKVGGRMVIPVRTSILVTDKVTHSDYEIVEHPGFIFVPLI